VGLRFLIPLLLLAGCSQRADTTTWVAQCDELIPGEYQACYGPGWKDLKHKDPQRYDNYQISVERLHPGGTSVIFGREFPASDIGPRLLTPEPGRVVSFERDRRRVVFDLGTQKVQHFIL
jgi:hypothetical protein